MLKYIKQIATYLFLLLFLQVIVPASLWHTLCDHEDAVECYERANGIKVAEKHQHCAVLDLTLPALIHQENVLTLKPVASIYSPIFFFNDSCCQHPLFMSDGRGPPNLI